MKSNRKSLTAIMLILALLSLSTLTFTADLVEKPYKDKGVKKAAMQDADTNTFTDVAVTHHSDSDITAIDWNEELRHDGECFGAMIEISLGLNDISGLVIEADPTVTKATHLNWSVDSDALTYVYIYANPTTAAHGDQITLYNDNANFATTSLIELYWLDGSMEGGYWWNGGKAGAGKQAGGQIASINEKVLAPSQTVGVLVVSKAASNNVWLHFCLSSDEDGLPE